MEDASDEKRNKSLHETACHKKKQSHCREYETKKRVCLPVSVLLQSGVLLNLVSRYRPKISLSSYTDKNIDKK